MNKVILCGNLTKDVEVKTTSTGLSIAIFSLAVQRSFKNQDGDYETDFINCKMFGDRTKVLAQYTSKGSKLLVEGSIQTGSYQKEDGTKVYTTDVIVNNFEFISSKNDYLRQKDEDMLSNYEETKDPFAELGDEVTLDDGFLD